MRRALFYAVVLDKAQKSGYNDNPRTRPCNEDKGDHLLNSEISKSAFSFAAPEELRVNLLASAFGVPKASPVFSWVMRSGEVGDIQTAYRIVMASRLADFADKDYLLDTGWVASDESSNVTIAGLDKVLADNELYYWAVMLRNKSGAESAMSEPSPLVTAVGGDWEDTRGVWCADGEGAGNFCFLRTEFKLADAKDVERAVLSITATSPEPAHRYVYHAFLDGTFVGLGPTRIGRDTGGEELLYYNTFDVTRWMTEGTHALAALCYTTREKAFLCQLTVFYTDGSKQVLFNSARDAENTFGLDGTAVFSSGHSVGTHFYEDEAENINATVYPFGFDRPGFDGAWSAVRVGEDIEIEHERRLEPYLGEPVERIAQDVASVERDENGCIHVDLGQEIVGGLRLTVNSPCAQTVTLRFGEELREDGRVLCPMRTGNDYTEQWTLRQGEQMLEGFGMKGFRYVDIENCPVELGEDAVKGIALRRRFDAEQSLFNCSNEVLCLLYDTSKYAVCATSQDVYVDSQTRERTPYEGDALINMLSAYHTASDRSLARFTVDYLLSHRTWPADYALLPIHMVRLDYLYTGDRTLLDRHYGTLRRLMLAEKVDERVGLIGAKPVGEGNRDRIMVDWPVCSRDGYAENAHYNTVYNALCYICLRDMTVMASVLGKEDEATAYRNVADNLRADMIELLYNPDVGAFRDGLTADGEPIAHYAQHATAYALCAGIFADDAMKDALGRTLVRQDAIRTSIYGAYFLIEALYRAGFGAYATALLASDDCTPGAHTFAAALCNNGATIAPEAWCPEEKPNMTFSHPWGASPAALIARGMFGIRPTRPGFHKFEIKPQIGDLPYAAIRIPTVKGCIGVSIGQNAEAYEAEVIVPPNTKATVLLPVLPGGTNTLFINNQISNFPIEKDRYHIELGSGTHRLLAQ